MDRTEIVTITNMCMVYDGNKVLVQEKKMMIIAALHFREGMWKKENPLRML